MYLFYIALFATAITSCTKKNEGLTGGTFQLIAQEIDGKIEANNYKNCSVNPTISLTFDDALPAAGVENHIDFKLTSGQSVAFTTAFAQGDSVLVIRPVQPLAYMSKYTLRVLSTMVSKTNKSVSSLTEINLQTAIDTTYKFPLITDDSLMTLVQKQTFTYFWDYGHPVSGLSRERLGSNEVCTSGGSGFGIMSIIVGVHRGFITRSEGAQRMKTITDFLKNQTKTYHGTFPHWLNGATGATILFSQKDDGADLVETSYLMQGLLCARQYFNGSDPIETGIRAQINDLFQAVEWDWFTRGGQNVLYWHWSEQYSWEMNHQIQGWNEALITYIMAASSPTHAITKPVYEQGWAKNGAIKNGKTFYGYQLPLGWDLGGPLFFEQYTFLGVDPNGLSDQYADYALQTKNHTLINYAYCKANPRNYLGYSADCWGLTASDTYDGYTAHEPNNDRSVITPTAALSSMPFTPNESMAAMRYFYFVLGDKTWKQYGFIDAFSLERAWYAPSFLAIDQGPIIVMIENHRSGLLWQLFTSCPEVKVGMKKLGFVAPYLP